MAFEQLMAEAAKKQEKKKETPGDKKKDKEHASHHHSHNPFASAKPPEEMSKTEAKETADPVAGQAPNTKS